MANTKKIKHLRVCLQTEIELNWLFRAARYREKYFNDLLSLNALISLADEIDEIW